MSPSSSSPAYTLHYWPQIPGRGEYVRIAFEAAKVPFNDNTDVPSMQALVMKAGMAPPHFAPPILEVGSGKYISQTPAILNYLAPHLGLLGDVSADDEIGRAQINQITETALDLSNEAHDVHHPISVSSYYEDQAQEALKRAADFKDKRAPKFFKYFELTIGDKKRLMGNQTTVADLTLFQVVDGLLFAFPKRMAKLRSDYPKVFELHQSISVELKEYLESDRRRPYSDGLFRHYPELDD